MIGQGGGQNYSRLLMTNCGKFYYSADLKALHNNYNIAILLSSYYISQF